MNPGELKSKNEKVTTTVQFLLKLDEKVLKNEIRIRKYLLGKHGLTEAEVEEAFRIHRSLLDTEKASHLVEERQEGEGQIIATNDGSRPEIIGKPSAYCQNSLWFLLDGKKIEGQQLLRKFLESEVNYYNVLECLHLEYYVPLVEMASENKFKMTDNEVEEIYSSLPGLLSFHKNTFYTNLNNGMDIAKTFLRNFKNFETYLKYMERCSSAVDKMREYVTDKKLHKCLSAIKSKSKCPEDEMIDLILEPLNRISDYRDFLKSLVNFADKQQAEAFELISKAERRIGRVATYIEKYKYGIFNRSEMNKVQQFLGKQCDIFVPNRKLVRRGLMRRRTTGWMARNKYHIFFLFNDIMLWTTKSGELQNWISLRYCEVMESDSTVNPERKLKIVFSGWKTKILYCDCDTRRQRMAWFEALKKTISLTKDSAKQKEPPGMEKEEIQGEGTCESSNPVKPPLLTGNDKICRINSRRSSEIRLGDYVNPSNTETPVSEQYSDELYEHSKNFPIQEYKDFEPIGDTISVSEYDINLYGSDYVKGESRAESLSPFWRKVTAGDSGDKRGDFKIQRANKKQNQPKERLMGLTESENGRDQGDDGSDQSSSTIEKPIHHRSSSIIRRQSLQKKKDGAAVVKSRLEEIPNITISWDNLEHR